MQWDELSFLRALLGGGLIGLAASLLWLTHGRIAGISGVLGGLLTADSGDRGWRASFVVGLVLAGVLLAAAWPQAVVATDSRGLPASIAAGLLVGVGVRLGSGCTSGHGVCGLSRGSTRSVAATLVFMASGMVTATLLQLGAGAL